MNEFVVVLCWPNRHVHCKFDSGSTFGTICLCQTSCIWHWVVFTWILGGSLFTSDSPFLAVNYSYYWPKFSKLLIINWIVVPVWTLNMVRQLFLMIILTISRVWVRKCTCIKKTAWDCVEFFFCSLITAQSMIIGGLLSWEQNNSNSWL